MSISTHGLQMGTLVIPLDVIFGSCSSMVQILINLIKKKYITQLDKYNYFEFNEKIILLVWNYFSICMSIIINRFNILN